MKPSSPELRALLASRQFYLVELFTFALASGSTLRYCAGPLSLSANGLTYTAGLSVGPYFNRQDPRSKGHWGNKLQVDSYVFDVIPGSALVLGAPFLQAIRSGVFDGAEVVIERAYMPIGSYGDTTRGLLRYFTGRVAEIDAGRSVASFMLNSHVELLNLLLPRNVWSPGCINNLGDVACSATIPTTTGVVTAGSTLAVINATVAGFGGFGAGNFDLGKVAFTSGAMNGNSFSIRTVVLGATSVIQLLGFMPSAPQVGDTFVMSFGCNKSLTDPNGCTKFSNQARFRGAPWIPQPLTAI